MKPTILIVDDEREIREMLERHFRFVGYNVKTADGVDAALKILAKGRVEVVISDIMMPGKKGTELLRQIHYNYPMTRVIMMTGYVTLSNALDCMRLGAETCVFKPLETLAEMDAAVERALHWLRIWNEKLRNLRNMPEES